MKSNSSFVMRKKQFYALLGFGLILLFIKLTLNISPEPTPASFSELKIEKLQSDNIILAEFNPNNLDEKDWEKLGFSKKQVSTILKYKQIVGGQFTSKAQLKKCYAISEEKYNLLEPYILLDDNNKASFSKGYPDKKLNIARKFNPDHLSQTDWQNMGFSEKQAAAILKYKQYLGGSFVSKEKLKECFMINDAQFSQMSPLLILPEKTPDNYKSFAKFQSKEKIKYQKFDPNLLDVDAWKKLGFSDKQAQTIVNYRDRNLKGSFKTLEEIQSCFVISEEKFKEMKPYIVLDPNQFKSNSVEKTASKMPQQTDFTNLDLNKISFKQLIEFGFDEKAAGSFIGFRKKLGGFMNKQQMLDTYNIDKELMEKLINTCKFSTEDVQRYSLVDAPEDWLKNHPYFKYSADKIIFYRISNPDDQKIWKYLKLKPEYETRMRWYVK